MMDQNCKFTLRIVCSGLKKYPVVILLTCGVHVLLFWLY